MILRTNKAITLATRNREITAREDILDLHHQLRINPVGHQTIPMLLQRSSMVKVTSTLRIPIKATRLPSLLMEELHRNSSMVPTLPMAALLATTLTLAIHHRTSIILHHKVINTPHLRTSNIPLQEILLMGVLLVMILILDIHHSISNTLLPTNNTLLPTNNTRHPKGAIVETCPSLSMGSTIPHIVVDFMATLLRKDSTRHSLALVQIPATRWNVSSHR